MARANLAGLATLAWAPPPPTQVQIDASELSNDTRLRWQAVNGAAGYRVVWRDGTVRWIDAVGRVQFDGKPLRELLISAIRYGDHYKIGRAHV